MSRRSIDSFQIRSLDRILAVISVRLYYHAADADYPIHRESLRRGLVPAYFLGIRSMRIVTSGSSVGHAAKATLATSPLLMITQRFVGVQNAPLVGMGDFRVDSDVHRCSTRCGLQWTRTVSPFLWQARPGFWPITQVSLDLCRLLRLQFSESRSYCRPTDFPPPSSRP